MISRITPSIYNVQTKNNPNFKSRIVKNDFLQSGFEYAKANPTSEDSFFFFKSLQNLLNDGKQRTIKVLKDGIMVNENGQLKLHTSENISQDTAGENCVKTLNDFAENENSFFKSTDSKIENLFNKIEEHKEAIEDLQEDLAIEMKESLSEISKKLN